MPLIQRDCDQRNPLENPFDRSEADQLSRNKPTCGRHVAPEQPTFPGLLGGRDQKGRHGLSPGSYCHQGHWPSPAPAASLPTPSLVQQLPHLWRQLSFSQFAPKDLNPQCSVAQDLLVAGYVNSLVRAKLLVVCKLRPACDFPRRCFRNL